jgi:hypothetical protein
LTSYIIRNFVCCALFTLGGLAAVAQPYGTELGVGVGIGVYQGDLSPHWYGTIRKPGKHFQLGLQHNIFPAFSVRANYAHASLHENEEFYTTGVHRLRKFSFETSINELSVQLVINPSFNNGVEDPGNIRPYFFGGVGVAFLSIKRDWSRFDRDYPFWQSWVLPGLAADSAMAMPNAVITVPVGGGIRYQLNDNIAIYSELSKRIARTEYLDGFSQSANRRENDGFYTITLGAMFRLSSGRGDRGRIDCPVNVW